MFNSTAVPPTIVVSSHIEKAISHLQQENARAPFRFQFACGRGPHRGLGVIWDAHGRPWIRDARLTRVFSRRCVGTVPVKQGALEVFVEQGDRCSVAHAR
jgi:hypothetical protein